MNVVESHRLLWVYSDAYHLKFSKYYIIHVLAYQIGACHLNDIQYDPLKSGNQKLVFPYYIYTHLLDPKQPAYIQINFVLYCLVNSPLKTTQTWSTCIIYMYIFVISLMIQAPIQIYICIRGITNVKDTYFREVQYCNDIKHNFVSVIIFGFK